MSEGDENYVVTGVIASCIVSSIIMEWSEKVQRVSCHPDYVGGAMMGMNVP